LRTDVGVEHRDDLLGGHRAGQPGEPADVRLEHGDADALAGVESHAGAAAQGGSNHPCGGARQELEHLESLAQLA
jgi:hypothetical protein